MTPDDRLAIEALVQREARLLDREDWSAWLSLFTADGAYWVPAARDQADPLSHVSLFYETRPLMEARIGRLRHPRSLTAHRRRRAARVVGAASVEAAADGALLAISSFVMVEQAGDAQRLFAGELGHLCVRVGGDWRIRLKRVGLLDPEQPFEPIEGFI